MLPDTMLKKIVSLKEERDGYKTLLVKCLYNLKEKHTRENIQEKGQSTDLSLCNEIDNMFFLYNKEVKNGTG